MKDLSGKRPRPLIVVQNTIACENSSFVLNRQIVLNVFFAVEYGSATTLTRLSKTPPNRFKRFFFRCRIR